MNIKKLLDDFNFVQVLYEIKNDEIYFKDVSDNFYKIEKIKKNIIGKKLKEFFPSVKEFGIYHKILKVYKTGEPLKHELNLYKDEKIKSWRYNYISKVEDDVLVLYHDYQNLPNISKDLILHKEKIEEIEKIANLGTWEMDVETGETKWSDEFFRICGFKPQSFKPNTKMGINIIYPEDRKIAINKIEKSISNKSNYKIEKRIVRPNGEIRHVRSIGNINDKFPNKIFVSFLDITNFKNKEKELKKKSDELIMIIDNMNRAFSLHEMIFDNDGNPIDYKFIRINKSFELMTGLSKNIIGKNISDIFKDESTEWVKLYAQIFTKNKTMHFEKYSHIFKKWYLVDAYKQNYNRFVTIFEDITERKKQEKQKSEIINSTLTSSFLTDKEGKILNINDKGCRYLKKTKAEIIGKQMSDLLPSKLVSGKRKKLLESILTGKPVYFIDSYNDKYFENYIYPIFDIDGSTEYIAIHGRDITEQEQIKNNLIDAKIKAENSDLLKSLFLANMSHEIKTPMNSIIGFSDILLDENFDKTNQNKFLKTINANAKHLEELINNILEYSKIESGEIELDILYEKFSINDLFDELEEIFLNINKRKNIDSVNLYFERRTKDSVIISDYLRLKQTLHNLISNAIKFTEIGHIRIGTSVKDNIITFFVEDTGIGIPNDKLDLVFEKFMQVDNSSKKYHQGAGLGLSISKSIINILGGNIWVDSKEKEGSTFFFTLPLDKKRNIKRKENLKNKYDFSDKTLFIIEDIPENYSMLGIMLKSMKVKTIWSDKHEDVYKHIDDIDAIIIDICVSNVDIKELLEKLKQIDKNVTIIAMSITNIKDIDCVDFQLMKPITKENISKILKKI